MFLNVCWENFFRHFGGTFVECMISIVNKYSFFSLAILCNNRLCFLIFGEANVSFETDLAACFKHVKSYALFFLDLTKCDKDWLLYKCHKCGMQLSRSFSGYLYPILLVVVGNIDTILWDIMPRGVSRNLKGGGGAWPPKAKNFQHFCN